LRGRRRGCEGCVGVCSVEWKPGEQRLGLRGGGGGSGGAGWLAGRRRSKHELRLRLQLRLCLRLCLRLRLQLCQQELHLRGIASL